MRALTFLLLLAASVPAAAMRNSMALCDDVRDPATLDPHRVFDNKSDDILFQIFEGLVRFDADGDIEPALATECRQADATTLRCRLRKGVVFHNGDPMDAEAVRWSVMRAIAPATGNPAAPQLGSISEVRVVDPLVVEIKTKEPDGLLLRRLASFVKIASPRYYAAVGAQKFAEFPVGTGPFRFVGWEKGKSIRLASNPSYWEKGYPKIKDVEFLFLPEETQQQLLFSGKLDLLTEIPATKTIDVVENGKTRVLKRLVLTTPAFWFTSFKGPLADKRVRKALNMAVNKDQLIRYAVLGNGKPVATLSLEGESGHNADLSPYPYSPEGAKRLLAEAGYAEGFELSIMCAAQAEREAKILRSEWRKIGVRAKVDVLSLREMMGALIGAHNGGALGYQVAGNLAPNPTAHMCFLPGVCFYSRSFASLLGSADFDRLYEELIGTVDRAEQEKKAKKLDAWIYNEALGVFTYQKIRTYALDKDLEIKIPVTGVLNLREAYWK